MRITVLGAAAGGGFPQWNCNCRNCAGVRSGVVRAKPRTQSSIFIRPDDSADGILFNASPDILEQIRSSATLQPGRAARDTAIAGVVLMDGQVDHATGLFMLRERGTPLPLWCTDPVEEDLRQGNPVLRVLGHYCGVARSRIALDGTPFEVPGVPGLSLRALPNEEGNYTLRLENVWFGVTKPNPRNRPPAYPRSAISARVGARLMVVAKLDARGNVVDVHPYQTSLDRQTRGDGMARRLRGMFERAGLAAVKGWKFTPGEMINGEAIGGSVMVPIWFQITENGRKPSESEWRAYVPGPISPAPWVTEESLAQIDTNALGEGDSASLESRFRLTSDVVGKAL